MVKEHDSGRPSGAEELIALREALARAGVPQELLKSLDQVGDPTQLLDGLMNAGVLPAPQDALNGLLEQWRPLLKRGTSQLTAELAGAEFVGLLCESMKDDEFHDALVGLFGQAEQHGGPEALAMLRVLAAGGPMPVRAAAEAAADRLAVAGETDRPWVAGLGRPKPGACFGYVDTVYRAQEVVAITFSYGRNQHVLSVLIDHDLGGGVKDCWFSDQAGRMRAEYQMVARRGGLEFRDYTPAEARAILERALAKEPCPVDPDQQQDVRDFLDLLRQRVALLPAGDVPPRPAGTRHVHQVKVSLRGARPPIWRRLEVLSDTDLRRLHMRIQAAFGWHDSHLWVFETPLGDFGIPDSELEHGDAAGITLAEAAPGERDRIHYIYDFGDNWRHDVTVEKVGPPSEGASYPRCTAGRRACPPEDSGGIWGYAELLEILADPEHEEHQNRLEWLGLSKPDEFDPAHFDLTEANRRLVIGEPGYP